MDGATSRWEHFPHGADVGIRGFGPTPDAAFAQAAVALTAVVTDPALVEPRQEILVECEAPSLEALFFDWIEALVFEMSTRRMVFSGHDLRIDGHRLRARVRGEPVDRARHDPAVEIKGPTFTELCVSHDAERREWRAQCVVDV